MALEAKLLEAARTRDNVTLGRLLFERFYEQVNAMVWQLLGPNADHNDIVHDVYLKLMHGAPRLRTIENLSAWANRITVNAVRSQMRRGAVRRRFRARSGPEEHWVSPLANTRTQLLLRRSFDKLERLCPKERIPFMLRRIQHLPLEEIAQLSGCSLATVKRRIARAEKHFAELCKQDVLLADYFRQSDDHKVKGDAQ